MEEKIGELGFRIPNFHLLNPQTYSKDIITTRRGRLSHVALSILSYWIYLWIICNPQSKIGVSFMVVWRIMMTAAMVFCANAKRGWKGPTHRLLCVLVSAPPASKWPSQPLPSLLSHLQNTNILLKSPGAFQIRRDMNFGFRHTTLKCGIGCELGSQPMGSFMGGTSCAQPVSTSFCLEKEMWKNCILWHITLGLKRLFLKITQKSLCSEALGPKCADTCKAEHNMQCVVKSDGTPDCVCLPGYQRDDSRNCQP